MSELLWSIGSPDGRSQDLVDNYMQPNLLGDVVWQVGLTETGPQRWPLFHPSEADPEGGYRLYPYTVVFPLDHEPTGVYRLQIQYLETQPRLSYLEVQVNGTSGLVYLRPEPSRSGEIRLHAGLHASIYNDGIAEVVIPAALLRQGENRLVLTARDGGEFIRVDLVEKIKRLDRMANGAGFMYQYLAFDRLDQALAGPVARLEVRPSVIYRRNQAGHLVERCDLFLELNGPVPASTLTVTLQEGTRTETVQVDVPAAAFGHLHLPFDLFDGTEKVSYRISGQPGGASFTQEGWLKRRRKWKVFITPHAHTDVGYTHRQWEVAERLCRNIDFALDKLREEEARESAGTEAGAAPPTFTYHLDSAWAMEHYLATRSPERAAELFRQIKAKRIGVSGIYVDLLTQTAALEDLIRNTAVADSMLRPHGLETDFAAVVDVASLSGSWPAILEGAGIKYLAHADNQDRGPFRLNGNLHKLNPWYWEGTNGGRVLCWLAKMYCELRKVCGSPPVPDSAERGLEMWLQEYETEDYGPDAVMLYGQEADNTDLDPQPIEFVRRWNGQYAYPQLIACDVSEFFRYVEERFGDQFQTVKGDGGAYWEDGAGSSIGPTIAVRDAQATLPAAERLEALAAIHTPGWAMPTGQFDEAWRQVLLYDEHTWGAFLSANEPEALLAKDQWAVKQGFADQSEAWAKRLLHSSAVRHSLNWNNEGREVVVYNPHSWTVSGEILVEIEPKEIAVDPQTGVPVPARTVQLLSSQKTVALWVDRMQGLSYRRFVLKRVAEAELSDRPAAETVTGRLVTLENDFYRLTADLNHGCVTSWFDKELNRELVDTAEPWGFGKLLYARGGEGTRLISNRSNLPEGNPEVLTDFSLQAATLERFAYGQRLIVKGTVPAGELAVEWTLPNTAKWVDLNFRYLKAERLEKEAVYVAFPVALPGAEVLSDSHLGWVNWDKDELPGGCKEWLPVQSSIFLSAAGIDVQICSPDIPLFTVGSLVRGRWPKEMDLTGGTIFSYVLNNYWHTNYKAAQGGELRFRYRLTSGVVLEKDQAFRLGWETRRGLYGHRMSFQDFRETRAPYEAPAGGVLARIGTDQVVLSTMTRARWADGFVLRLQEIGGQDRKAPVAIPGRPIARAWLTDLLERDVRKLPVATDGSVTVPVAAWRLATVRIEFE